MVRPTTRGRRRRADRRWRGRSLSVASVRVSLTVTTKQRTDCGACALCSRSLLRHATIVIALRRSARRDWSVGASRQRVLLRDRSARHGWRRWATRPDYQRLAAEVLGIRNAPPELARRLVAQALVVEDRRDELASRRRAHLRARRRRRRASTCCATTRGRVLYVGKAINLRRRLRAHFAERRWRGLKAPLARVADAEWHEVGSELEALLREAELIHELRPVVNVQRATPRSAVARDSGGARPDVIVVRAVDRGGFGRARRRAGRTAAG